ncbi:ABC-2 transporter permease [Bacillus gaemokensis]|uniref:ABC transporter permease n=1 Tax=Bacillus gaemokensis TaxID=574375 RepID=A0A073KI78_9BACI|nr:ABC-2 transporter permease [Bacillus gaemokensis]KEK26152.1 ABC transporter permease [Bacillus gaemokensis]KYG38961.1 ABC transporter permease [Bacillus gaemokensis]
MRQLVYKDLLFFYKICIGYFVLPIILFSFDSEGEVAFIMSCGFIAMFSFGTVKFMDQKNKSEMILNSLPLERKDIIIAKYISCAIFIVVGMMMTTAVVLSGRGIASIGDIGVYHPNLSIEVPWYVVIRSIVVAFLYFAIFLPIEYSRKAKRKGIAGVISALAAAIPVCISFWIGDDSASVKEPFGDWILNLSHIGIVIAGGIVLASIYIISMFITIKLYKKRDI